jgi:hypothetical protein
MQNSLEIEEDDIDFAKASEASGKLIRELESGFDVNSLTFRGIRIWPRLRSQLVFAHSDGFYSSNDAPLKRYGTLTAVDRLAGVPSDVVTHAQRDAHDLDAAAKSRIGRPLAFLGSQPRQTIVNGAAWNPLFDPLIGLASEAAPSFTKLVLQPFERARRRVVESAGMLAFDYDRLMTWLAKLESVHELCVAPPAHPRQIAGFEAFRAKLPKEIAENVSATAIVKDITFIERLAIVFRIFLERARPPCIFISGQRRVNMAMTLAARQLGIPTVDIQHGASSFSPVGYKWHSWSSIPHEGYELLPDYFWVWGERAADLIRAAPNPSRYHKPLVGGHPALLEARRYSFPAQFASRLATASLRILVTLGPLDRDGLPDWLLQAISRADETWLWLLRMHPQNWNSRKDADELRTRLTAARVENYEVEVSSAAPLAALFPATDRHVTLYSSSAVEATAFGVPTIFAHPLGARIYGHLFKLDGFDYAIEPDEILALLSAAKKRVEPLVRLDRDAAAGLLRKLVAGLPPLEDADAPALTTSSVA